MSWKLTRFFLIASMLSLTANVWAAPVVFTAADPNTGSTSSTVSPSFTNSNAKYSQFLGALSSYGVDNLESYAPTGLNVYANTLTFSPLSLTAAVSTPDAGIFIQHQINPTTGGGPSQGSQNLLGHHDFGTNPPNGATVRDLFTFSQPVTAFGLYLNNVGDAANITQILFTITYANATPQVVELNMGTFSGGGTYSTGFVGITDTNPITSILIRKNSNTNADGVLYDNITAGVAAIPEPTTWACMLSCGLAGGIAWRRRQGKTA
jgi:hypothetical protein